MLEIVEKKLEGKKNCDIEVFSLCRKHFESKFNGASITIEFIYQLAAKTDGISIEEILSELATYRLQEGFLENDMF